MVCPSPAAANHLPRGQETEQKGEEQQLPGYFSCYSKAEGLGATQNRQAQQVPRRDPVIKAPDSTQGGTAGGETPQRGPDPGACLHGPSRLWPSGSNHSPSVCALGNLKSLPCGVPCNPHETAMRNQGKNDPPSRKPEVQRNYLAQSLSAAINLPLEQGNKPRAVPPSPAQLRSDKGQCVG